MQNSKCVMVALNYNQDLIMKKLLVLFMFIMVTHAHAFTLNDLIGTYKVTLKEAPVVSTITVEAMVWLKSLKLLL